MYCRSTTLVKWGQDERTATSIRCRSWLCPDCQDDRKRQLMAECHGGSPNTFLTLTSRRRPGMTPEEAAAKLAHSWRLIRLRLMRLRRWKRLPFMAVVESTKLGWPHLHILLRSVWIDKAWLSAQMAELHDSPIVDIQRIDNKARVLAYVAKYCGKASHKFGTCKRYWKSRDYELREIDKDRPKLAAGFGYERESVPLERLVRQWIELGFQVTRLSLYRVHCRIRPPTTPPSLRLE